MSNNGITLYEGSNATPLQVREDRAQFPRIKDTAIEESVETMYNIIVSSYLYVGRKVEKEQVMFTTKSLVAELLADDFCKGTKNLAWIDIQRAIRRGILGAGKEMYGISVATLYQAVLDYLDEVVKPAQTKLRQMQKEREEKGRVSLDTMASAYAGMMARANEERTKEE